MKSELSRVRADIKDLERSLRAARRLLAELETSDAVHKAEIRARMYPQNGTGTTHRMRTAIPSHSTARRLHLNRWRTLRVWCDCMDHSSGMPWGDQNDPRRLGSFDPIGYVDIRVPNSALDLYHQHLKEVGVL